MQIVIMDKETTTANNDICFARFNTLGEVVIYDNLTSDDQVQDATIGADVIVLNKVVLDAKRINNLPSSIKVIAITATGYDNVDVPAATSRGIKVFNVPGYGTNAVSQLAMQLILSCSIQLKSQLDFMSKYGWDKKAGLAITMHELSGKTLGIVGLGAIGTAIAKLAQAFGMKIIGYNRSQKSVDGVVQVDLANLAQQSDYVSLSMALNSDTHHIIDSAFISKMKPSAYLINTARGGLIDESALIDALINNKIAGAALDVLIDEPPHPDNKLLTLDNVLLTPHIGWAPIEARQRCIDITYENIVSYFSGNPQNQLN